MMRKVLTATAGILGQSAPLRPWMRRLLRRRKSIAYYHFVGDHPPPHYAPFYTGSTLARFREDLRRFKRDFEIVPLESMLQCGSEAATTGRPQLAITFDDGFDLFATGACEVLQDERVPATFFIINDCLDNRHLMWRNKLAAIGEIQGQAVLAQAHKTVSEAHRLPHTAHPLRDSRLWDNREKDAYATQIWEHAGMPPLAEYLAEYHPYFSSQQVRDLQTQGHTIGLHTKTHCLCSGLDATGIQTEIVDSSADLRKRFDLDIPPFSYPFGDRLSSRDEQLLVAAGTISCALGIAGASQLAVPPYGLERAECEGGIAFPIYGRTLVTSVLPFLLGQRYG